MAIEYSRKRVIKDIQILSKNKDDLEKRGIYYYIDENNLSIMWLLINPEHKHDTTTGLVSPYIGGFFMFKIEFPDEYPMTAPKVEFYPKQNAYRLHPNYYESGKVCLSMINTWGNNDWCPSMSILSLTTVLEERFNERPLSFEPGFENESVSKLDYYNKCVKYGVFDVCMCAILEGKYHEFNKFNNIIQSKKRKCLELAELALMSIGPTTTSFIQPCYTHKININYVNIVARLRRVM